MADVFNAYVSPAIYGVINAILAVPALYGYAAVIFSAPVYGPIQGPLSKAVVLSSAVHQVVFALRSTLPFAIGQVQDAGLIFLGKMATIVAAELADEPLEAGQQKRAKFPTSKAHISAGFHSFRLIFGRAIISRNGLEAWMLFSGTRARGTLMLNRR